MQQFYHAKQHKLHLGTLGTARMSHVLHMSAILAALDVLTHVAMLDIAGTETNSADQSPSSIACSPQPSTSPEGSLGAIEKTKLTRRQHGLRPPQIFLGKP